VGGGAPGPARLAGGQVGHPDRAGLADEQPVPAIQPVGRRLHLQRAEQLLDDLPPVVHPRRHRHIGGLYQHTHGHVHGQDS